MRNLVDSRTVYYVHTAVQANVVESGELQCARSCVDARPPVAFFCPQTGCLTIIFVIFSTFFRFLLEGCRL